MGELPGRVLRARRLAASLVLLVVLLRLLQIAAPSYAPGEGGERGARVVQLDPNRAPAELLAILPGIGPVRARAIVARRESAGPFTRLEDLLEVPGIGESTMRQLAAYLVFSTTSEGAEATDSR